MKNDKVKLINCVYRACHCEQSEAISSHKQGIGAARRDCFAPLAMTQHITTHLGLLGPYDKEDQTIAKLMTFIEQQGYEIIGEHEEEYLKCPGMFFAEDSTRRIERQLS